MDLEGILEDAEVLLPQQVAELQWIEVAMEAYRLIRLLLQIMLLLKEERFKKQMLEVMFPLWEEIHGILLTVRSEVMENPGIFHQQIQTAE